ncbi:MAG TPA: hypothetical protein VJO12_03220 [Stellaceae bacterium]|nr:hypothetical protein [Stellaceae bacterium]
MSNPNVPGRALLALLLAVALAAAWPVTARAAEADQPEAGTADTESTDDKPAAEGFAPDEQETAAPTAAAVPHNQAMCARLDDLMGQGLSYAERGKAAETRAALHCPPAPKATQAAEGSHIGH